MYCDLWLGPMELLFTCLFLTTYKLPEMLALQTYIHSKISRRWFQLERCYQNLIALDSHLQTYKAMFQELMKDQNLGLFSKLQVTYASTDDFPHDLSNSCLTFFEKLLHPCHTPANEEDLEKLLHHASFAVQYTEASPDRLNEVVELVQNVTNYLGIQNQNYVLHNVRGYDEIDFRDTKFCDCYEYEKSGDCSCID